MPPDTIELTTPSGRDWDPVMRLVLGGIADRLDLGFEELDDLQLAVERLLARGRPRGPGDALLRDLGERACARDRPAAGRAARRGAPGPAVRRPAS